MIFACKLRLTGIKDELKHVEKEMKKSVLELKQSQVSYDALSAKIEQLQATVFAAEDSVFATFCGQIGVSNIREYEERQLKVAQEESEARLRFDNQIARLTHQSEFEQDQMKTTDERLAILETTVKDEQATVSKLEGHKHAID